MHFETILSTRLRVGFQKHACWKWWDHFAGSRDGGMTAENLGGRTESLEWPPPKLTFDIERHAGTVSGSTAAAVQHWEVDLDQETAALIGSESGQIIPMDRRVDVISSAAELATAINEQREDPRIEWVAMNRVRILTSEAIPATKRMTTTSRRTWFVSEIERLLQPLGWQLISRNPLSFEQQITDFSKANDPDLNPAPVSPETSGSKVVELRHHRRRSARFSKHTRGFSVSHQSTFDDLPTDIQIECSPATPCGRLIVPRLAACGGSATPSQSRGSFPGSTKDQPSSLECYRRA
jgi:hypothetical protein